MSASPSYYEEDSGQDQADWSKQRAQRADSFNHKDPAAAHSKTQGRIPFPESPARTGAPLPLAETKANAVDDNGVEAVHSKKVVEDKLAHRHHRVRAVDNFGRGAKLRARKGKGGEFSSAPTMRRQRSGEVREREGRGGERRPVSAMLYIAAFSPELEAMYNEWLHANVRWRLGRGKLVRGSWI